MTLQWCVDFHASRLMHGVVQLGGMPCAIILVRMVCGGASSMSCRHVMIAVMRLVRFVHSLLHPHAGIAFPVRRVRGKAGRRTHVMPLVACRVAICKTRGERIIKI